MGEMVTVVVPMAGKGTRFKDAGYVLPKPLIPVGGVPMGKLAVSCLRTMGEQSGRRISCKFLYTMLESDARRFDLERYVSQWDRHSKSEVVLLKEVPNGPLASVMSACDKIDPSLPLVIANCDQVVEYDFEESIRNGWLFDGVIVGMRVPDRNPKWSYVKLADDELCVRRIVEKVPITDMATLGIYHFARARNFLGAAAKVISKGVAADESIRGLCGGEFFVSQAYQEMINMGMRVRFEDLGEYGERCHGIGTPEDLDGFLKTDLASRIL